MNKTQKITNLAMFSACIIVLQLLATYINFGSFPITLTLIPIIIGGALYGKEFSTILGLVFGAIVLFIVLIGGDPNSLIMLSQHPIITIVLIFVKGGLTGYISGLVYSLISNKKIGLIISGLIAPIINTGVFTIFLLLFFDTNIKILISIFISINFVIELLINGLLTPGLFVLINKARFK